MNLLSLVSLILFMCGVGFMTFGIRSPIIKNKTMIMATFGGLLTGASLVIYWVSLN
jgi:uncharacterized membrane protein